MIKRGKIIIVSGPSGVGKKTILDKIIFNKDLNLKYSISSTTREKRKGEINGIDYFFLSNDEFDKKIKNNEFIEWAEFADNRYGTLRSEIENNINNGFNVLLEIEVQGGKNIINQFDKKDYISIFIIPPSIEELEKRLIKRGTESLDKIKLRLSKAESELGCSNLYDKVVLNDETNKAAKIIEKIIKENVNE